MVNTKKGLHMNTLPHCISCFWLARILFETVLCIDKLVSCVASFLKRENVTDNLSIFGSRLKRYGKTVQAPSQAEHDSQMVS